MARMKSDHSVASIPTVVKIDYQPISPSKQQGSTIEIDPVELIIHREGNLRFSSF